MWKLIKIFLKFSLLYKDQASVEEYLHQNIVTKEMLMNEEEFNGIHSIGKISLISYKLTYAFSIGKKLYGILFGYLLVLITLLPSLLIMGVLFYLINDRMNETYVAYANAAIGPVMAAYFVSNGLLLIKKGYSNFPLITFISLCIMGGTMVFVLQWPISLVLVGSLFFFLCFMKGGNING